MKFLVRFLKNPCDGCITKAACQSRSWMWKSRNCPDFKKYDKKKTNIETRMRVIIESFYMILLIIGFILIIVTFVFGMKTWWDIFEWLFS